MKVEQVYPERMGVGEGIGWAAEQGWLHWVDITGRRLYRGAGDQVTAWDMPTEVGFCAPHVSGGVIVGLNDGFALFDPSDGGFTPWGNPEPHMPGNRFNDAAVDRQGRLWAGTMPLGGAAEDPEGTLYRLDGPGVFERVMEGFWTQNGMAFSPDGTLGYVSDSVPHVRRIWRFSVDPETGAPGERELFFDTAGLPGRPDGATVDSEGCYWMAGVGGWQILRITPEGIVDRQIDVPVCRPTKLAFGGSGLVTLYVSTMGPGLSPDVRPEEQPLAGCVLALRPGVSGVPDMVVGGHD